MRTDAEFAEMIREAKRSLEDRDGCLACRGPVSWECFQGRHTDSGHTIDEFMAKWWLS